MSDNIAIGATVAVIERSRVLLCQREDFEVWCLPGGHNDPGESLAATAIREVKEEVGLDVALDRFVGIYSRLGATPTIHLAVFAAHPIGGAVKAQVDEVIDIAGFDPGDLPRDMFWWHRQPIADAAAGVSGVADTTIVNPPEAVNSRQELYDLRDRSGMERSEFYHDYFEGNRPQLIRNT